MKSLWVSASTPSSCSDLSAFTYNYSFRTYAFPNTLRIRARKRVVLRNSLPTEHACSWTMTERKFQTRKIYFLFLRARNHLKIRPEVIDSKWLDWVLRILGNIYRFSWESRYWAARTYDEIRSPFSTLSCLLAWFVFLILFSLKQLWPNCPHGPQIAGPQSIVRRNLPFAITNPSCCSERSSRSTKKI